MDDVCQGSEPGPSVCIRKGNASSHLLCTAEKQKGLNQTLVHMQRKVADLFT